MHLVLLTFTTLEEKLWRPHASCLMRVCVCACLMLCVCAYTAYFVSSIGHRAVRINSVFSLSLHVEYLLYPLKIHWIHCGRLHIQVAGPPTCT